MYFTKVLYKELKAIELIHNVYKDLNTRFKVSLTLTPFPFVR